jgi:hypothetical protein
MVVLNRLVTLSLGKFASKEKADDIENFFKNKDVKGFDRGLAQVSVLFCWINRQSLDLVKGFARWVERDVAIVEEWLKAKNYLK